MSIFLTSITACPENRERNWGFRAETNYYETRAAAIEF